MYIPLSLLSNGSAKRYRGNEYTLSSRRTVGLVVFCAVYVVSKESRRLVLPRSSCLICIHMEEFGGTGESRHNNDCQCSGHQIAHRCSDWLRAGRLRDRRSNTGRVTNFLFSTSSRSTLGLTQTPIQCVPGALSPGVKRPVCEDDHSPQTSAKVKKMWICTSTFPYTFMA
jgi:hypothetical protein